MRDVVDVPGALQADLRWMPQVPAWQLAEMVASMCQAPELDPRNTLVQHLLCGVSEVVAARAQEEVTIDVVEGRAIEVVGELDAGELVPAAIALGVDRQVVTGEVRGIDREIRRALWTELARIAWRARRPGRRSQPGWRERTQQLPSPPT